MTLALVVIFLASCLVVRGFVDHYDLPPPAVIMNVTRDDVLGLEKRVYRRLASKEVDAGTAPLFEGMGTHYSFIWVGTPPQRVSVIMDTGSHHTAFPCTGCKCGKHMDPHFDPQSSTTSSIASCGGEGKKCYFKQSYTEGSSWSAFKVRDRVWVGGPGEKDVEDGPQRAIDFDFGCQESETGLFRTQKVDGIMGLSAAPDTLPFQLHSAGVTRTKMFALCFRTGGGVVTLGGVDTRLHALPAMSPAAAAAGGNRTSQGGLLFAQLIKPKGWYTVRLLDVLMRSPVSGGDGYSSEAKSIGGDPNKYAAGKGTIVDSGTTDTYLPSAVRAQFQALFRAITGREYSNKQAHYSKEQFAKLPTVVFRLQAAGQVGTVDLEVAPSSYMEYTKEAGGGVAGGAGRYTPRIYLTEGSGAVLGANAINEHNVIFDIDRQRVGFARSRCTYEREHSGHDFATSTSTPAPGQPIATNSKDSNKNAVKGAPTAGKVRDGSPPPPARAPAPAPAATSPGSSSSSSATASSNRAPPISPVAVPLTGQQQAALSSIVQEAAYMFVASRVLPCKAALTIPCNARCDHSGNTVPVEDGATFPGTTFEYLRVSSAGAVSVASARVERGQQYWRVPQCAALASGSKRRLSSPAGTGTGDHHLRGLEEAFGGEPNAVETALGGDWALPKLLSLNSHTVMEECAVACSTLAGQPGTAGAGGVRVHPTLPLETTPSQCDPASHTRKQLRFEEGATVDVPADGASMLVLRRGAKASCVVVRGAPAVQAGAEGQPELEHGAKCQVASVVETPCKPYLLNCTSPARTSDGAKAASDAVSVDPADVVLTLHLRLKGLPGGTLTALQSDDLVTAFSSLFQVPAGGVSVVADAPAASRRFSLGGSSTALQVYLRLNTAAASSGTEDTDHAFAGPLRLPTDAVKVLSAASKTRAGGSKSRQQTLFRQLVRDQLLAYVEGIVRHEQFPEVLAAAVADANSADLGLPAFVAGTLSATGSKRRAAWLVGSALSVVGVTSLAGRVDSTSLSAAEKARTDLVNAEICAGVGKKWPGLWHYLGLGRLFGTAGPAVAGGASGHPAGGGSVATRAVWALFFFTMLLFLASVAAGLWWYLRRRQARHVQRKESEGGGCLSVAVAALRAALPSAEVGGDEEEGGSDAERGRGREREGRGGPAPQPAQAHSQASRDRRRKVLQKQKFSFKK